MIQKSIQIKLETGLEARPVAMLVQVASQFDSKVYINSGAKKVNAKSIMGMMSLGFGNGDELIIEAEGSDEAAAVEEIKNYIESVK